MNNDNMPWLQYICLACGLVYDEEQGDPDSGLAPGTRFGDIPDDWECPLCGVTKSDFELLEKQEAPVSMGPAVFSHEPGILVVGAGVAGWSVVEAIRALDSVVSLTLVSACSADRYHKPELSVALSRGQAPADLVRESAVEAANRLGVRLLNETFVVGLSAARRELRTTRGTLPYTRLVLAQGAKPALPEELPAALCWRVNDLAGWSGLHRQLATGPQSIAIVGAGMVGCELAEDLAGSGHRVTLLDRNCYPLAGLIPAEAGLALQRSFNRLGIDYRPETRVVAVAGEPSGTRLITLGDGAELGAAQVIAATGLVTDHHLARQAGLAFNKGIEVDTLTLRTSDPDIYALGDCISFHGKPCRFIEPIANQARTIAHALLGLATTHYQHKTPVIRLKTRALPLVIHGLPIPAGHWEVRQRNGDNMTLEQRVDEKLIATLALGR